MKSRCPRPLDDGGKRTYIDARMRPKSDRNVSARIVSVKRTRSCVSLHSYQTREMSTWGQRIIAIVCGVFFASSVIGCSRDSARQDPVSGRMVVYCSMDETFARDVLATFQKNTGIEVAAIYDSEAGKTTGLVNRIVRESQSGRPGADVWWSGELFGTMHLAKAGLLDAFDPPSAADIPGRFRDSEFRWTALANRARVLAFTPRLPNNSPGIRRSR